MTDGIHTDIDTLHSKLELCEDELRLCENENSNLRKHLLWCAKKLQDADVKELKARLRGPVEDGGVTGNVDSDILSLTKRLARTVGRFTDHMWTLNTKSNSDRDFALAAMEHAGELRCLVQELGCLLPMNLYEDEPCRTHKNR